QPVPPGPSQSCTPPLRDALPICNRAAALAPVPALGLVAIWDDGDDLHAEPRAPYPHAREVLLTRAQLAGAGALVAGYSRTAEAQDRKSTRLNSSHVKISYAVFCW